MRIEDFYADATQRIAAHLDAGRNVALLAEGDPLFYSSYMHLHTRLTQRFDAVIVPGVTSVSAASAAIATPLVAGDEVLSVLPGTLPVAELTRRLADADAAVVLKLGRSYHAVREALSASGQLDDAFYVERASTAGTTHTARRGRRRDQRAVLLAGHAAGRATGSTAVVAAGHRRGGGPGSRRQRLDDAAEPTRAGRRDRSDRLRAATWIASRFATASGAIPATTPTNPRGRGWPARWPSRATPWRWCRRAIRACSRWPPPCWKRPNSGPECGSGSFRR